MEDRKITKRFYFGFTIKDGWQGPEWKIIRFYCFYLKQYPPEGEEEPKFGRDYIGINFRKNFNNVIKIKII